MKSRGDTHIIDIAFEERVRVEKGVEFIELGVIFVREFDLEVAQTVLSGHRAVR